MRYGIFSDVHGSLEALQAVMKAYKKEAIDKYLCAGDIVGYGADPIECIKLVRESEPVIVAGNHDWAAAGKMGLEYFNPYAKEAVKWTQKQLGREELKYLKDLKLLRQEQNLTLVHGTLYEPGDFHYVYDIYSAGRTIELCSAQICIIGHSHIPFIITSKGPELKFIDKLQTKIDSDIKYIINAGSVGQPRDNDPRACFCVYDTESQIFQIKRIEYDIKKAQAKILKAGLPEILATRLAEGR